MNGDWMVLKAILVTTRQKVQEVIITWEKYTNVNAQVLWRRNVCIITSRHLEKLNGIFLRFVNNERRRLGNITACFVVHFRIFLGHGHVQRTWTQGWNSCCNALHCDPAVTRNTTYHRAIFGLWFPLWLQCLERTWKQSDEACRSTAL
jgi:hypothetical protein